MALTSSNIEMIQAIARNNLHAARTAALASLAEDRSKKNAGLVDQFKRELTAHASIIMSSMPNDLRVFLTGETPDGFRKEQYYPRENEMSVFKEIRTMKLTADLLSEKGIRYRNTTLLYGKSGTGKTELGRYVASELNLPFFYISFAHAIDSYMGSTAKNLSKIFEFCSSVPCVLMLDEVDCISIKRAADGSKGADGELERTTISLMQELDKLPSHVVLIATTNRPDLVDDALTRRFLIRRELFPMTKEELLGTAEKFLSATETEKYVSRDQLEALATKYSVPGRMIPELIKLIGAGLYEEHREQLDAAEAEKDEEKLDLWQVTYIWQKNIPADTEADAIAIAKNNETHTCSGTARRGTPQNGRSTCIQREKKMDDRKKNIQEFLSYKGCFII